MTISRALFLVALGMALGTQALAAPNESQIERGHHVYQKWCYPCHGPGTDKPGTNAMAAQGLKPAVLEERTDLTPAAIKGYVRHGIYFMPTFRKTEISDADLDAIAAYLTRSNKPAATK